MHPFFPFVLFCVWEGVRGPGRFAPIFSFCSLLCVGGGQVCTHFFFCSQICFQATRAVHRKCKASAAHCRLLLKRIQTLCCLQPHARLPLCCPTLLIARCPVLSVACSPQSAARSPQAPGRCCSSRCPLPAARWPAGRCRAARSALPAHRCPLPPERCEQQLLDLGVSVLCPLARCPPLAAPLSRRPLSAASSPLPAARAANSPVPHCPACCPTLPTPPSRLPRCRADRGVLPRSPAARSPPAGWPLPSRSLLPPASWPGRPAACRRAA